MLPNANAITANVGNVSNANRTINDQVMGDKNTILMQIISTTTITITTHRQCVMAQPVQLFAD